MIGGHSAVASEGVSSFGCNDTLVFCDAGRAHILFETSVDKVPGCVRAKNQS